MAREKHLKNVLLAIRNVNQLIVHESDPQRLIEGACEALTETLGYHNAWIALTDREGRITATASSGFGGQFDPVMSLLERGEFTRCMGEALERDSVVVRTDPVSECPDCPLSHAHGDRAGLAHRVANDGRVYGLLAASVPREYAQDHEEHAYLREVACDLGYALHKIEITQHLYQANHVLSQSRRWPLSGATSRAGPSGS